MAPFRSPKRKVYIASFGLEELHGLRNRVPAMGWFYTTWFASIFAVALPAIRYPYAISVYFEFYQSCFFLPTRLCRAQVLHSGGIKVIRARDRQSETFLFGVQKGDILFHEREYPSLNPPRERFRLAVSGLNNLYASGMQLPARGVAALDVAIRFAALPLLLSSAAALPIL